MKKHVLRLLSLQRKTQGVLEGVVCVVQPKAPGVLGGGVGMVRNLTEYHL